MIGHEFITADGKIEVFGELSRNKDLILTCKPTKDQCLTGFYGMLSSNRKYIDTLGFVFGDDASVTETESQNSTKQKVTKKSTVSLNQYI